MSKQSIDSPFITIVCPCFNEEASILTFLSKITDVMVQLESEYELVCVNDGSTDDTFNLLLSAKEKYSYLRVINFSRNFGKEAALSAGIDHAKGEYLIFIDADLQDPPTLIPQMLYKAYQGFDVVVAKRINRDVDTKAKRITAEWFYKIHNFIADIQIPENVGDFRLITRKVAEAIKQLPENQRFMKGIFAWVGFNTATIEYKREQRKQGKTKFSLWQLWNFAIDGITSFSSIPLKVWVYLGSLISIFAFCFGTWIILKTLILGVDLPGYASIMTTVLFLGGIQLISIGVLGEYIGRIYMESKKRPIYIIENEY